MSDALRFSEQSVARPEVFYSRDAFLYVSVAAGNRGHGTILIEQNVQRQVVVF